VHFDKDGIETMAASVKQGVKNIVILLVILFIGYALLHDPSKVGSVLTDIWNFCWNLGVQIWKSLSTLFNNILSHI